MRCSECCRLAYRAKGAGIASAEDVIKGLPPELPIAEQESFWALMLDAKNRVTSRVEVAKGSLTRCEVVLRDAFREAVRANARAVIFAHNHPSGDPTPSADDDRLTARLREAGTMLGVVVLDHVIVAEGGHFSYASRW
jgi:DNA repair protein RadC